MITPFALKPTLKLIEPQTGYLTRDGFQFFQSLQQIVTNDTFQPADTTLDGLAGLGITPGFVVQTGVDTFNKRTLEVTTGLDITNPAGTAGNPSISLDVAEIVTALDPSFLTPAEGNAAYQPLDADLTTLATTFAATTWSPTLTATVNLDAVTLAGVGHYFRVGARIVGAFVASVDPTAAADANTQFSFTLPVASNFAAAENCLGSATFIVAQRAGSVSAHVANNVGMVDFAAEGTAAIAVTVLFSYIVI